MKVTVNDDMIDVPERASVRDLLAQLDLDGKPCAVEVNRRLVPKREHESTGLADGDRIEIVTLVGGG